MRCFSTVLIVYRYSGTPQTVILAHPRVTRAKGELDAAFERPLSPALQSFAMKLRPTAQGFEAAVRPATLTSQPENRPPAGESASAESPTLSRSILYRRIVFERKQAYFTTKSASSPGNTCVSSYVFNSTSHTRIQCAAASNLNTPGSRIGSTSTGIVLFGGKRPSSNSLLSGFSMRC